MKSNVIAAIDPGRTSGAVCIMAPQRTEVHLLKDFDMRLLRACSHVFLEKAQPMVRQGRKQGASGIFSYAAGYGEIIGWLKALQVPFTLVPPATWGKVMHAGTDTKLDSKARSIQAAQRIFPGVDFRVSERGKVPHDGKCEAALICEYGRRVLAGGGK
jgi:hypothetical protein